MTFEPILQTVEDKENPDYVEEYGPFPGVRNTWLGRGCYFWDRFYEIAEWWGETHYHGKYMICSAVSRFDDGELLDLVGSTYDMDNFKKSCEALEQNYPDKYITVSFVIEYLKEKGLFAYKALRAHSIDCGEGDRFYRLRFRQSQQTNAYLNLMPAIQLCIYDKSYVKNYRIIYPEDYVQVV